jgi:WD40 repeat protein
MDSDEEEMKSLRKAPQYAQHSTVYGRQGKDATEKGQSLSKNEDDPMVESENAEAFQELNLPTEFGKKTGKNAKAIARARVEQTKRSEAAKPAASAAPAAALAAPAPSPINTTPEDESDDEFIGPPPPAEDEGSDAEQGEEMKKSAVSAVALGLPISHELILSNHAKPVTALSLDPSGARLVSGGYDYQVRFWDFAGMDSSGRSFRGIEPSEGHAVRILNWNSAGDSFVVGTGSAQPKIFDREGREIAEFPRGDMYLSDLSNTKGHLAEVTAAQYHPTEKQTMMTAGMDGSIRLWDVSNLKKQKVVIKVKNLKNTRGNVSCAKFSADAKLVGCVTLDGSMQIFDTKGPYHRPSFICQEAHFPNTEATSIAFASDSVTLVTRGGEDNLKVWDLRNVNEPIKTFTGLQNLYPTSSCLFSPNDRYFVCGTSVKKNEGSGVVIFYDKHTLQPVKRIGIANSSAISILWHPKINQLLVGCSDGKVRVLFDPEMSYHGALLSVVKAPRRADPFDLDIEATGPEIPMEDARERRKRREREKAMQPKAQLPEKGVFPRMRNALSQHLIKAYIDKIDDGVDSRAELLKYAKASEENPFFFAAYKTTQPQTLFDMTPEPEQPTKKKKPS